jgi:hypothetical protein
MTMQTSPATSHTTNGSATAAVSARSRRWLVGAFLLAGAAQLITVSALTSADPVPATWPALLLATAPAPLAAAAAFSPLPARLLAVVVTLAAIIVGGAGQITHTGLFFAPALVLLAIGGAFLWRERPRTAAGVRE